MRKQVAPGWWYYFERGEWEGEDDHWMEGPEGQQITVADYEDAVLILEEMLDNLYEQQRSNSIMNCGDAR